MSSEFTKSWWKENDANACGAVDETISFLTKNQDWRRQLNLIHMRLYQNMKNMGMDIVNYASFGDIDQTYGNRLTLNVIQSGIDTLHNRIAKNNPRVTFLTDDGSFAEKKRARKLTKFMNGVFKQSNVYEATRFAFLDGCVFGTGAVHPYRVKDKIFTERVWPNEILVDDVDGAYMDPRQIFRVKSIPRSVLIANFPQHKTALEKAKRKEMPQDSRYIADNIMVTEAVHLPSGEDAKDGKRIISIPTQTLSSSVWEYDYLPYEFWRFKKRLLGFDGIGAAEMLSSIQLEINRTIQVIQKSLRLTSVPRVFLQKGSGVIPSHLNNEIGSVVQYVGQPPIFDVARSVSPELARHLENLYQKAFEILGISQLSSQSKKPSGLDAAVALREFDDIESERHVLLSQSYQDMHINVADRYIDLMDEISKEKGDYEVKVKVDSSLETIKWSEVKTDRKNYQIDSYPTSLLPTRPEGRLQKVTEMSQAGFFSKEESMELLDFPDISSVTSRKNAGIRILRKIVDRMLDAEEDDPKEDVYMPPEPYLNLTFGIKFMQESYLEAKLDNVEDFKLQYMRDWINQAKGMIVAAAPAAPAMPPMANPEAAPVSDLLPIQNAPEGLPVQ